MNKGSNKKPDLSAVLNYDQGLTSSKIEKIEKEENVVTNPKKGEGSYLAPSRGNKTGIQVWVDPTVVNQLKMLGLEQLDDRGRARKQQDLLKEALNLLFVKYGKPEIANA